MINEDLVFKALADSSRRFLLDLLHKRDGQTLSELEWELEMTRFGVMKHLDLLEAAGLITTRKVGREKRHYLNPAPLQDVDVWIAQYRRFWDARLDRLEDYLRELQAKEQRNDHNQP